MVKLANVVEEECVDDLEENQLGFDPDQEKDGVETDGVMPKTEDDHELGKGENELDGKKVDPGWCVLRLPETLE